MEDIKLGFLPIGQIKMPVMEESTVGSAVAVMYNQENPAK